MSFQVSAVVPPPTKTPNSNGTTRRSANFKPSLWGDYFLSYASDNEVLVKDESSTEFLKLKDDVKRMLSVINDKLVQKLWLMDAIQRLGLSYHFDPEIDELLKEVHSSNIEISSQNHDNDLYTISLAFRLLRQQGHKVSCDVFNKFKDGEGNFKDSLKNDAPGMLSLFEAAHLRVHGEDILDEAVAFTTSHLEKLLAAAPHSSSPLAEQIANALKQPIRKGLTRVEARKYIPIYERDPNRNETLLTFAKLDFNILQKLHQKELGDISKWWKEVDIKTKIPFARDRLVECYFWILGIFFEPEHYWVRRILTKVISMTSVLDDVYDVYGTPEELQLFTQAVERWDISVIDELPEYLRVCYKAVLDIYAEIEQEMINQGRAYRVFYAKEAMKNQVRAYFQESKWFHQRLVPTFEEYMSVATISSGYHLLSFTSFVGMGDIVTQDSFNWLCNNPKIMEALSVMCRLMDDIVSHKFEQERGHAASSIECYMNQYGTTEEETIDEFRRQITNAWKDINESCLCPTAVPLPLLTPILNLARVMEVLYKEEDGYTNPGIELKLLISSLLVDPVPM